MGKFDSMKKMDVYFMYHYVDRNGVRHETVSTYHNPSMTCTCIRDMAAASPLAWKNS